MGAHTCPSCGARLMSFSAFFRRVDPGSVVTCAGCGRELHRSSAAWAVLAFAGGAFAALPIALTTVGWSPGQVLLATAVALPAWIVGVKLVGWTLVPWIAAPLPRTV